MGSQSEWFFTVHLTLMGSLQVTLAMLLYLSTVEVTNVASPTLSPDPVDGIKGNFNFFLISYFICNQAPFR